MKRILITIISLIVLATGIGANDNKELELQRAAFKLGACYALYLRDNGLTRGCKTYGDVADKAWVIFVSGGIKK
jgi:hypothetical protein